MVAVKERPALTKQQARVLAYMARHFAEQQSMPAIREIADAMGFNGHPNGALCHLLALVKKGYLEWERARQSDGERAKARSYRIVGLSEVIGDAVKSHVRGLIEGAV